MGHTRGKLASWDMADAQGENDQGTPDAQSENGQGTPDAQGENGHDTPTGDVEEPETIAMRRLKLKFELRRLQLESEERITLYNIQLDSGGSTWSSTGSRVGDQGPVDPVAQCAKVLKGQRLPCDEDIPIWFDEVEKCS